MNSEPQPSDRATEFRQALVATANLGPYVRRRPPLKLVIGSVAAFALAGALTGGAIATAGAVDPQTLAAQAGAAGAGKLMVSQEDGTTVGAPFVRSGSGTVVIDLGRKPAGATGLVEGMECIDPGKFVEHINGKAIGGSECSSSDAPNDFSGGLPVLSSGAQIYTLTSLDSARFSVWLSWVNIPKLADSVAQKQELSDGMITRDEVVAAFSRYEGCMGALGHPIDVPPTNVVPSYSIDGSGVDDGSDNRCYVTEYQDVDMQWQDEIESGVLGDASIEACLTMLGVTPASTPDQRTEQLQAHNFAPSNCIWIE
jgi:hypothetical protein